MSRSAEKVLCECAPGMALFADRREPFGIRGITHVHCFWARPELNGCGGELGCLAADVDACRAPAEEELS